MTTPPTDNDWPALAYQDWNDSQATLHMWTQVVGKVALALAPPLNHCWSSALQVTPRGLTTRTLPYDRRTFTLEFDFIDHRLVIRASDGVTRTLTLEPRTVADFYRLVMVTLEDMALAVKIWPMPVEIPAPIRFEQDTVHASYDREAVDRWWQIVSGSARVFAETQPEFIGKSSPVHFFWGSFDLAVTRFSGRPAPPRDGPAFMRDAYSHEVISHGFWPGGGPLAGPAFYAYAVPEPAGLKEAAIGPAGAGYNTDMGEFLLPYDVVRAAPSPAAAIREFVRTTYARAATLGGWDREALERAPSRQPAGGSGT